MCIIVTCGVSVLVLVVKVKGMVDQLLATAQDDVADEVRVVFAQYEATFAADGLMGPSDDEEEAAEEEGAQALLGALFAGEEGTQPDAAEDEGAQALIGALLGEQGAGEEGDGGAAEEGAEEEGGPAEEATQGGRGGFRLRGKSFLFTFNWDFFGRRFPDGTAAAANADALWELWRVWKRGKKAERKVALI
jgi:hypothetical protein